MVQVGRSILLQLVVNFVVNDLEFYFFYLLLLLNFKPYFIMSSKVITGEQSKPSNFVQDSLISVLISNYPLSNGGYLVSFGKDGPEGSFENYDPSQSLYFEDSMLSKHLDFSSVFLPAGCYYLPEFGLACFIKSLACGSSFFEMKLLPASHQMQGLLMVKVNEGRLLNYEQKKED